MILTRESTAGAWTGRMRTALLRDDLVKPTEYSRWADAHRYFETHPGHRRRLLEIMQTAPDTGITEPLCIGITPHSLSVHVGDGHHRAVAVRTLALPLFPFCWYWATLRGVRFERVPFPFELVELS